MKADEGILPGIFADDVGCMVSGAVVLNDQFMDGVGLCQNRVQLLAEKLLSVIGTHDDGYGFHEADGLLRLRR